MKTMLRYKIPAVIVTIFAVLFLALSLTVLGLLICYSFGVIKDDFVISQSSAYQIGIISTTVAFGLFTIQFTIRNLQKSFAETIRLSISETNKLLDDFMKYIASPDYSFVESVCHEIIHTFSLQKLFDSFESNQQTFATDCCNLITSSKKSLRQEIINCSAKMMSVSSYDCQVPQWFTANQTSPKLYVFFMHRFLFAVNKFEYMSYCCINDSVNLELFQEQFLPSVKFIFLMSLVFDKLGFGSIEAKSISYQAIKLFIEK